MMIIIIIIIMIIKGRGPLGRGLGGGELGGLRGLRGHGGHEGGRGQRGGGDRRRRDWAVRIARALLGLSELPGTSPDACAKRSDCQRRLRCAPSTGSRRK